MNAENCRLVFSLSERILIDIETWGGILTSFKRHLDRIHDAGSQHNVSDAIALIGIEAESIADNYIETQLKQLRDDAHELLELTAGNFRDEWEAANHDNLGDYGPNGDRLTVLELVISVCNSLKRSFVSLDKAFMAGGYSGRGLELPAELENKLLNLLGVDGLNRLKTNSSVISHVDGMFRDNGLYELDRPALQIAIRRERIKVRARCKMNHVSPEPLIRGSYDCALECLNVCEAVLQLSDESFLEYRDSGVKLAGGNIRYVREKAPDAVKRLIHLTEQYAQSGWHTIFWNRKHGSAHNAVACFLHEVLHWAQTASPGQLSIDPSLRHRLRHELELTEKALASNTVSGCFDLVPDTALADQLDRVAHCVLFSATDDAQLNALLSPIVKGSPGSPATLVKAYVKLPPDLQDLASYVWRLVPGDPKQIEIFDDRHRDEIVRSIRRLAAFFRNAIELEDQTAVEAPTELPDGIPVALSHGKQKNPVVDASHAIPPGPKVDPELVKQDERIWTLWNDYVKTCRAANKRPLRKNAAKLWLSKHDDLDFLTAGLADTEDYEAIVGRIELACKRHADRVSATKSKKK